MPFGRRCALTPEDRKSENVIGGICSIMVLLVILILLILPTIQLSGDELSNSSYEHSSTPIGKQVGRLIVASVIIGIITVIATIIMCYIRVRRAATEDKPSPILLGLIFICMVLIIILGCVIYFTNEGNPTALYGLSQMMVLFSVLAVFLGARPIVCSMCTPNPYIPIPTTDLAQLPVLGATNNSIIDNQPNVQIEIPAAK